MKVLIKTEVRVCVCMCKWPEQDWHLYESYGPSEWKDGKLASVKVREQREKVRTTVLCYYCFQVRECVSQHENVLQELFILGTHNSFISLL